MIWQTAGWLARRLPAETAHQLTITALRHGLGPRADAPAGALLRTSIAGLPLANPLGLAAGFDKNAEAVNGCFRLGFGAVEVGTITPRAQPGNPRPRVFRLAEDAAVINRYGFNNDGMDKAWRRLGEVRKKPLPGLLGVNIGANKTSTDREADYFSSARLLAPLADYLVVNVSSPNTPGLRGLQQADQLRRVLRAVTTAMAEAGTTPPLFLKLAPDLEAAALAEAVEVAVDEGCKGLIISNTTISRPGELTSRHRHQQGGLSGKPLFALSTAMLHNCRQLVGDRLSLIAAGGVCDAATAWTKIACGAELVQIYSGLALAGPALPLRILQGLAVIAEHQGISSLDELRGSTTTPEAAAAEARAILASHAG